MLYAARNYWEGMFPADSVGNRLGDFHVVATGSGYDIKIAANTDITADAALGDIIFTNVTDTDTIRITALGIELCGAILMTEQDTVGFRAAGFTGLTITTDSLIYWISGSPAVLDHVP